MVTTAPTAKLVLRLNSVPVAPAHKEVPVAQVVMAHTDLAVVVVATVADQVAPDFTVAPVGLRKPDRVIPAQLPPTPHPRLLPARKFN